MITFILDLEVAFNFCVLYMYKTQYIPKEIEIFFSRRLLGVRTEGDKKGAKVQKLAKNEVT